MTLGVLISVWMGAAALRMAFLMWHLRDPGQLWYDYERGGLRFHMARWLDRVTFVAFLVAAVWALSGWNQATPHRLSRVFVAWLGTSLLARLPVHRFPRLNVPGAMRDAQIDLAVHLLMALLGALAATAAAALYLWWAE